jgi:hypothetical protein
MDELDDPSSLWKPILSLKEESHDVIEEFLLCWFCDGYEATADTETFFLRWSEMIDFALTADEWDPERVEAFKLDEMVCKLMGYDFGIHTIAADPKCADNLAEMIPLFEAAAQKWFSMPTVVNGFAKSLSRPGYEQILCHGIRWIFSAMPRSSDYEFWRAYQIESNLISALHLCWEKQAEAVRTERDLQASFLGLLTALSSRGNHAAMALRDRLLHSCEMDDA